MPTIPGIPPPTAGDASAEIDTLLAEIAKLGGIARRIGDRDALLAAKSELVEAEQVSKAALWQSREMQDWSIPQKLTALGVEIVPSSADKRLVAEGDLGITSVDALVPNTGTLVLRASPERSPLVSLLPRAHWAIVP